jgi:hypothetical protein
VSGKKRRGKLKFEKYENKVIKTESLREITLSYSELPGRQKRNEGVISLMSFDKGKYRSSYEYTDCSSRVKSQE